MRWTQSLESERGSEVVSTILVQALVVLVLLGSLQLAFALHVRTMTVSAASEGARRGAILGGNEDEARQRTEEILNSMIGAHLERDIDISHDTINGRDAMVVTVRTRLPLLGNLGPRWLGVRGAASWRDHEHASRQITRTRGCQR